MTFKELEWKKVNIFLHKTGFPKALFFAIFYLLK